MPPQNLTISCLYSNKTLSLLVLLGQLSFSWPAHVYYFGSVLFLYFNKSFLALFVWLNSVRPGIPSFDDIRTLSRWQHNFDAVIPTLKNCMFKKC